MKIKSIRWALMVGVCAALGVAAGCNSGGGQAPEGSKAVDAMQGTYKKLANTKEQITRVNTSLDQLTAGDDLNKSFKEYSSAIDNLREAGIIAYSQGEEMKARKQEFLDRWEKESSSVQNPEIRASMDARRQKMVTSYDKVRDLSAETRSAYTPFLQDGTDIQKALTIDLTPANVKSLQPIIAKVRTEGATLATKIDALSAEMDSLIAGLSPSGANAAK